MEIRNLLRVIFRVFGLYSVVNLSFNIFPQSINYLINADIFFPFDIENGIIQTWIYLFITLVFTVLVFYFLIINPDLIIKRFKPSKFLDEKIDFGNLNSENLLQIAILSIGILVLFDSLPELINKLFIFLKLKNMNRNVNDDLTTIGMNSEIIVESIKTLLGFVFVIFQNKIGRVLYKQNLE